jgi:hypothetical protein
LAASFSAQQRRRHLPDCAALLTAILADGIKLGLTRCCRWPAPNSFAEYAPEPNPETKKDVVWFAFNDDRPLFAFAGIWTEFKGERLGTRPKRCSGRCPTTRSRSSCAAPTRKIRRRRERWNIEENSTA